MIAPRKNTGVETPTIDSTVSARSRKRPAEIALSRPKTIPSESQMIPAPIASDSVAGRSRLISCSTLTCCV